MVGGGAAWRWRGGVVLPQKSPRHLEKQRGKPLGLWAARRAGDRPHRPLQGHEAACAPHLSAPPPGVPVGRTPLQKGELSGCDSSSSDLGPPGHHQMPQTPGDKWVSGSGPSTALPGMHRHGQGQHRASPRGSTRQSSLLEGSLPAPKIPGGVGRGQGGHLGQRPPGRAGRANASSELTPRPGQQHQGCQWLPTSSQERCHKQPAVSPPCPQHCV